MKLQNFGIYDFERRERLRQRVENERQSTLIGTQRYDKIKKKD